MSDSVVKIWNERMTQIMMIQLISYFIKNVFLVPPRLHQVCYRSVTIVTGILLGEDKTDITGLTKSDPDIWCKKNAAMRTSHSVLSCQAVLSKRFFCHNLSVVPV